MYSRRRIISFNELFFVFTLSLFFIVLLNADNISYGQTSDSSATNKQLTTEQMLGYTLFDKEAPEFTDTTLMGQLIDLSKMADTLVVLNFWFIQCKACRLEIPYLNKLQEDFKDKKIKLISFALNTDKELLQLQDTISKKIIINNEKICYEIITNCKTISDRYFVYTFPTTFVIKSGKIRKLLTLSTDSEECYRKDWKKEIKKLLD
jgi:thiol-disulfide isomerase/thioredoxin